MYCVVYTRFARIKLYTKVSNTRNTASTNRPKKLWRVSSKEMHLQSANVRSPSSFTAFTASQPEKYTAFSKCRYRLR